MIVSKTKVTFIAFVFAWCLLGACSGCGGEEETGPDVLITVNGEPVKIADLQLAHNALPPEEFDNYSGPEGAKRLLDEMITWKLIAQEAEQRRLDEDPAFQDALKAFRQRLLVNALLDRTVTEADVYRYYQEHFIHGRMIAVEWPEGASEARKKQAEEKAQAIYRELENGADFAELAAEKSDHLSSKRGGDTGYVSHDFIADQVGFTPAESLFGLREEKSYTRPVEGNKGYYLFQLLEPPGKLNPAGLTPQLRTAIKGGKQQEAIRSLDNELRSRSGQKIEYNEPALQDFFSSMFLSGEPDVTGEDEGSTAAPEAVPAEGETAQGGTAE